MRRALAVASLCVLTDAGSLEALVEGPPGANVGDTPARFGGMAVDVDVGAHTGNATFAYPLQVPPGRNGFQPAVSLVYSHSTKDTDIGYGWELPLGKIERVTRRGVPRYSDTVDSLQVTLPDRRFEIVRTSSGWAARYDDVHVWVTANPAPALRMTMPSGLVYTFGDTESSRVMRPGSPVTTANVFAWHLTRLEDPNGNRIDITYVQEAGHAYPDTISYGGSSGGLSHVYDVAFAWGPRSNDAQRIACNAGFCRTLKKQLNGVLIARAGVGLATGYLLNWQPSAVNQALLLKDIQVIGSTLEVLSKGDGAPASTTFQYFEPVLAPWNQGSLPNPPDDSPFEHLQWAEHGYASPITYDDFNEKELPWRDWKPEAPCTNRDFIDINADGLPDWVRSGNWETTHNWTVRLNLGQGKAAPFGPEIAWPAPMKCLSTRKHVYWLYTGYTTFGGVEAELGEIDCDENTAADDRPRCSQSTRNGLVDLDGDGRVEYVDAIHSPNQTYWKVWFQKPDGPGFQEDHVAWSVPAPAPGSAMVGRRYALDFAETVVADYDFTYIEDDDVRYITVNDQVVASDYDNPNNKPWVKLRQRPVQALLDMNGDGRPDLVDVGLGASIPGQPSYKNYGDTNHGVVRVYWNLGNGFAPNHEVLLGGPDNEAIRASGSSRDKKSRWSVTRNNGKPERNVTTELFDINADGLRDFVKARSQVCAGLGLGPTWEVWYGTGASYPSTHGDALLAGEVPSFDGPHCWAGPHNDELREWKKKRGVVDVMDVNADGLPDYVNATNFKGALINEYCDDDPEPDDDCDCDGDEAEGDRECHYDSPYNPLWRVWINTGTKLVDRGFVFFPRPIRRNAMEKDDAGDDTTSVGIIHETFDLDGNGYPDSVQTGRAGHLKINYRMPDAYPPNVLVRVTNPLGGTTDIDYEVTTRFNTHEVDWDLDPNQYQHHLPFPVWVVKSITQSDPVDGEDGTARTRWDYRGGYFDPVDRTLVGFRSVDEIRVVPDPEEPGALKDGPHEYSEFHQTAGREGRKRLDYLFVADGYNGLLKHQQYTWDLDTRVESSGWRRYFATLEEHLTVDASSHPGKNWRGKYCPRSPGCPSVPAPGGFKAKLERYEHDECGNVTKTTTYDATESHRTNSAVGNDHEISRISSTFTVHGTCDDTFRTCSGICDRVKTRTVRDGLDEEFEYERGNQKTARRKGMGNPTIRREFDDVGNLWKITDARGTISTIAYDTERRMYPKTWIVDVGGKHHVTEREYHPLFGAVTKHTDPAGAITLYDYDAFGRLKAVAEPGQTLAAPTRRYTYVIDAQADRRSRIETDVREPSWNLGGDPYRKEVTFFDGLARQMRRHVLREVAGVVRTVVEEAVGYDATGQVVREFSPAAYDRSQISTFVALPFFMPHTKIVRDEFFREVSRRAADGTVRTTDRRNAWVTKTCDALHASNVARGECVATEVDALERTVGAKVFLRNDLSATRSEVRTYARSGALDSVTITGTGIATPVVSTYEYDTLIRLKEMHDSSSGTWEYGYDLNDNRTLENDPTPGRSIETTYDRLNRIESRTEIVGGAATRSTTMTYDGPIPFGTGRPYQTTRLQPDGGFNHRLTRTGYDARGNVTNWIQLIQAGTTSKSFTGTRIYDAIGRLVANVLPAPGGTEAVLYARAATGEVVVVGSNRNSGPNGIPVYVTDVEYDERGRITVIKYGNGTTDTLAYHTSFGSVPGGLDVRPGYGDRLARLTTVHQGGGPPYRDHGYTAYDLDGRITEVFDVPANGVHQAAAYDDDGQIVAWSGASQPNEVYEYDALGRLTNKEGVPYTYSASRPFHIATFDGGAVVYDDNGNLEEMPGARTFEYDASDNLALARLGNDVTRFFTDDAGKRRIRVAPTGDKTFFFDDFDVDVSSGTIRRHIRLNGRLVATSAVTGSGMLQ